VQPKTLDHVALWVADRDAIAARAVDHLGMHEIDRTDRFTLMGADARRFKLTLFAADGPRDPGPLEYVALRMPSVEGEAEVDLGEGLKVRLVESADAEIADLDHVALLSADPEATAREYERYGFRRAKPAADGSPRLEVGDAWVELHPGTRSEPERPLLNHLAVLVDSAAEVEEEAGRSGIEIDDVVDAANTLAVFVWLPERVKLEYVEHKPGFALV
jgi:catechol 2,3-dioxygenase-like lactoylglutathione lyase family enzyme